MTHLPLTRVRTTHALTIQANGVDVGLINNWAPDQSRTVTPIFEVGSDGSGNPVEAMPGNISGLTLNIGRYDTYKTRLEEAFGTPDLVMLTRQNQPFVCIEKWLILDETSYNDALRGIDRSNVTEVARRYQELMTGKERYIYQGCWFTRLGRSMRSDDVRIVNVNATLMYTKKERITEATAAALGF